MEPRLRVSGWIDSWTQNLLYPTKEAKRITRQEITQTTLRPIPLLMIYGMVMGSFGLFNDPNGTLWTELLHLLYSSSKIPILTGLTFLLALPGFYVFYMLAGLAEDFRDVIRAFIHTQAVFALALASLSPFTLLFYLSIPDYLSAVLFNGLMFAVAALVRQIVLRRQYAILICRHPRHRLLLRLWFLLYAFIGIQTGWLLRPWVGVPGADNSYLREDTWSIAYLELLKILRGILSL
ncbi:MAG: hypothetical protein H6616_02560 [Ignavibacteria bacterium]|nr:hypothetical protein [Ignavibacteria bacterium]